MKKGEMSMNMIIMAVIAIIILVIIIFLVTRSSGDANSATACASKGGLCQETYCDQILDKNNEAVKCPPSSGGQQRYCCAPLS